MRRWIWLPGALLLLLGGAHYAYWRTATAQLRTGYAQWMAGQRADGWTVSSGKPATGGWPFAATLTLPELFIAGASPGWLDGVGGELTWSTDHLTLRLALMRPRVLQVISTGLQRVRLGEGPEIPYTADGLQLDVPLDPSGPPRSADLQANDLRVGLPVAAGPMLVTAGATAPPAETTGTTAGTTAGTTTGQATPDADAVVGLTVGLLKVHVERAMAGLDRPSVLFLAAAEAIGLPPRAMPAITAALGTRLSSLSVEGAVPDQAESGAPDRPTSRPADPRARARAWRDAGETVQIGRLALGWGPLGLSVTARIGLDQELQPTGTGTARIIGFSRTLDALAASHAIGTHAALAVKALLGLIAQPEGAGDAVEVPLTLQDGLLSVRQMPLLRLPALEWN